ncbi:hypothetical protein NDU88_005645 [Pleurodeles waltl]|uniref:Uncharacterized protein n=1 Tax=Pleurodeles waltl TaxID=8319 RepID=A0AAV7QJH3_PLEWA|nr:hypothetical protein NDU88_005645 [Pleurodeles waltl]
MTNQDTSPARTALSPGELKAQGLFCNRVAPSAAPSGSELSSLSCLLISCNRGRAMINARSGKPEHLATLRSGLRSEHPRVCGDALRMPSSSSETFHNSFSSWRF